MTETLADGRCWWAESHPLLTKYHDREWGVPRLDDIGQFEHLALETFQAGLSWLTILKKRDALRRHLAGFEPAKVAELTAGQMADFLSDAAVIRSPAKLKAVIQNARLFLTVSAEFGGFVNFLKKFCLDIQSAPTQPADLPALTAGSQKCAEELKKRGFKFLGAVTVYAHMQAVGLVNDHLVGCPRRSAVEVLRRQAGISD